MGNGSHWKMHGLLGLWEKGLHVNEKKGITTKSEHYRKKALLQSMNTPEEKGIIAKYENTIGKGIIVEHEHTIGKGYYCRA